MVCAMTNSPKRTQAGSQNWAKSRRAQVNVAFKPVSLRHRDGQAPVMLNKMETGPKRRAPGRDGAGGGAKPLISKGLINHVAGPQAFAIVRQLQSMAGGLMAHETDYQPGSMDISAHV